MIANKRKSTFTWTWLAAAILLLSTVGCAKSGFYVGGGILCKKTTQFALCTSASCTPDKSDENIAICDCVVASGPNFGTTKCEEREKELLSNFSPIQAGPPDNYKALVCNSPKSALCLDAPCTITDPNSTPPKAQCKCTLSTCTPWFTLGGGCDPAKCDQLWSVGLMNENTKKVLKAFSKLGVQGAHLPKCSGK